jgi:PGF-pre-PGF domain-containing protein
MQSSIGSLRTWGNRAVALCLVVLLVGSLFASVATAVPAMGFRSADVSASTVVVGENVTVSGTVVNVGDSGGGYTFEFKKNRTDFASQRVQVPADERRTVTANVSFDRPGTYKITVNENLAGYVTVQSARARVVSESDTQRRINIKANGVSASEPTELDIPSSNRSVALERWSTTTGGSTFQQHLIEYSDRSEVPETLPAENQATILGVVSFDSVEDVQATTMQFGVDSSALENSTLQRDEVTVYQRNGSTWDRLETSVIQDSTDRVVYEATATRGSTYAIGNMNASISIGSTTTQSTTIASGQRVVLNAVIENDGPISGTFDGSMRVNGNVVNETTVTVPAAGETNLRLTYDISDAGTYDFALNEEGAGTIILSERQAAGQQGPTGTAASESAGISVPGFLPATVFGINSLYLGGGLAIALGAFVAILAVLRRSDDGASGSDGFDRL